METKKFSESAWQKAFIAAYGYTPELQESSVDENRMFSLQAGVLALNTYEPVGDGDSDCAECGETFSAHKDDACPAALASLAPAAVEGEPVAYQLRKVAGDYGWCFCDALTFLQGVYGAKEGDFEYRALYTAAQVAALTAQCEGLRKDAERYRWLRRTSGKQFTFLAHYSLFALDEQIDSAIGEEPLS